MTGGSTGAVIGLDEGENPEESESTDPSSETEEPSSETEEPSSETEPVVVNPTVTLSKTAITVKSRGTATITATVKNGGGDKLYLEYYSGSKWVTKATYNVPNTDTHSQKVTLTNEWWYKTGTLWRCELKDSAGKSLAVSATLKVTTQRYYQNPSGYLQIKDKITLSGGGYNLYKGYMGLKVYKVNKYFGIGSVYWPRYTSITKSRVKAFQRRKGLKATGNVNLATWKKMGYSESSWYSLGAYVTPKKSNLNYASSRSDYVNAMVKTAESYVGAKYVVGASGRKKNGLDCSGLIMQCMYGAGVSIPGINPVTHSKRGHEYESRNMWKSKYLKRASYKNRKKGDLIFYQKGGVIIHVALYVGNNKIIHSWPNRVMKSSATNSRWGKIAGVKRIFK